MSHIEKLGFWTILNINKGVYTSRGETQDRGVHHLSTVSTASTTKNAREFCASHERQAAALSLHRTPHVRYC